MITILGTVGGLLLAIGLCMCLLPEWNAFTPGVILAAIILPVEGEPENFLYMVLPVRLKAE